jgi:nucleoredoxin
MKTILVAIASLASLAAVTAAETPIFPALKGDLVKIDGNRLKKFDESTLAQTKYYGIYYSASWCGPCRKFTPKLASWYEGAKKENPHFELIFVSKDESEQDMVAYMKEYKMAWPALDFRKARSNKTLTQYARKGIPCLVLVDDQGKVLSHSYEDGKYVGPQKVLADIEQTLKANPATDEMRAAAAASSTPKAGSSSFDEFFKKKPERQ